VNAQRTPIVSVTLNCHADDIARLVPLVRTFGTALEPVTASMPG